MGYRILSADEPNKVESIVCVIFGQPGIGKTSLAFTAEKCLLEDYDNGVQRSVNRQDALKLDSWQDAVDFHNSGYLKENGIKTLIIDTAGTLLDNYMAQYVMPLAPKNSSGGTLTQNGYGVLKNTFNFFCNSMRALNIDLIFVCHETESKTSKNQRIPKMTGGSYDILVAMSDMVGYMESINNKRTIDFEPKDSHTGKNTAEFELIDVPHYSAPEYQTFMGDLITKTKAKMEQLSDIQKAALETVNLKRDAINKAENHAALEPLYAEIQSMVPAFKLQLTKVYDDRWMAIYQAVLAVITAPADFDAELAAINLEGFNKRYIDVAKKILLTRSVEAGLVFNKTLSKFEAPQAPTTAQPTAAPAPAQTAPPAAASPAQTPAEAKPQPPASVVSAEGAQPPAQQVPPPTSNAGNNPLSQQPAKT